MRCIGPLYMPLALAAAWLRFDDGGFGFAGATAGLLLAVALFLWGAWKWAGIRPWAARLIGIGGMAAVPVLALDIVVIAGPLLLFALPVAWPGVTGPDGRRRFLR